MADQFVWKTSNGGLGLAADWSDLTVPGNVAVPGTADAAAIAGGSGALFSTVTGQAGVASLGLSGNVALAGRITAGSVSLVAGGTLQVTGGRLVDTSASFGPGLLQVTGSGASFRTSGQLSITAIPSAPGSGLFAAGDYAVVQAGSLLLAGGTVSVDSTAAIEIGNAGPTRAGSIWVDPGATLTSIGGEIDADLVVLGRMVISGGRTSLFAGESGGTLEIGSGSTLYASSHVYPGASVMFSSADGMLQLPAISGLFEGVIDGFTQGDAIDIQVGSLTNVTWNGDGLLTLYAGPVAAMTLVVVGNYFATPFLAQPDGNGGTLITLSTPFGTAGDGDGSTSAGTAAADQFIWTTPAAGVWDGAGNWTDASIGGPAAVAPGRNDSVSIAGPTGRSTLLVYGPGDAASLAASGHVELQRGRTNTGSFQLGGAGADAVFSMDVASSLVAGSLALGAGGRINLAGTSSLKAASAVFTATLPGDGLALVDGSSARFAGLLLAGGTLSIDATSRLDVGTNDASAAGRLTVDAGTTLLSDGGMVNAPSTIQGILLAGAGTTSLLGAIAGTGTLEIGPAATLWLLSAIGSGSAVGFTGVGGVLRLETPRQMAATVTGFAQGDAIDLENLLLTDVSFAGGVLALGNDGAPVLAMRLAGNYAGSTFVALPDGVGGTLVMLAGGSAGSGHAQAASQPSDSFSFVGSGDWGTASNWMDLTTGGVASMAPNEQSTVGFAGGAGFGLLSGSGFGGSVGFSGNFAQTGTVSTQQLAVSGSLDVLAGGRLYVGSANVTSGGVLVDGPGAAWTVSQVLTIGAATVTVTNGSGMRVGAVALAGGTIGVDAGGAFEIGVGTPTPPPVGVLSIDAGFSLTSSGGLLTATVTGGGALIAASGLTTLFQPCAVPMTIGAGGTLYLAGAAAGSAGGVSFAGAAGTLRLGSPAAGVFTGSISGFAQGDAIDIANTPLGTLRFANGILSVGNGTATAEALHLAGSYDPMGFRVAADGQGGTLVSLTGAVPCFAAGTGIRTPAGDVPVEALRVGDAVTRSAGGLGRIVWMGRRRVDLARQPEAAPVRVCADAFGAGLPTRDLFLSPDHAVLVDGALVPIRYLVNGTSIRREFAVGFVEYFHVEMERHEVLLAEGLPAESYLDTGNRDGFAGGGAPGDPARALAVWRERGCAPLLTSGAALVAVRRRLLRRLPGLGWLPRTDPMLRLRVGTAVVAPRFDGGLLHFDLPPGGGTMRLLSRVVVPAESLVAGEDHRRLGVAVAGLWVDGAAVCLDGLRGAGWHAAEAGLRWTDGAACLWVPARRRVSVRILPLLEYWERDCYDIGMNRPQECAA